MLSHLHLLLLAAQAFPPTQDSSACCSVLLAQIRGIIREDLTVATAQISDDLLKKIKAVGGRVSALEAHADDTTVGFEAHEDISFFRDKICELKLKLEDLENCSRRCYLQIIGMCGYGNFSLILVKQNSIFLLKRDV